MPKAPRKSRKAAEKSGESLSRGAEETAQAGDKDVEHRGHRGRAQRPTGSVDPSSYTGVKPPSDK
ncbi:hypothetical protein [Streptomyces sp. RPT161]|uniref:hypothetical protein n=1 Tax=Streptomyces sp. RPT161 TaxID=3015993 RepID=UPI0022B926D6|nr:hypothetical protein [Streptomyces sp. RPT161]